MKYRLTAVVADDEPETKEALLSAFLSSGWKEHRTDADPTSPPPDCLIISLPRGVPPEQPVGGAVKALALRSRLVFILADAEDLLGLKTPAELKPTLLLAKSVAPEIVCRLADIKLELVRTWERAAPSLHRDDEPMRL